MKFHHSDNQELIYNLLEHQTIHTLHVHYHLNRIPQLIFVLSLEIEKSL